MKSVKHDERFIFTAALLLLGITAMAQNKEEIHNNLIGKWAWTETVITPGKSSNPEDTRVIKVITPESCNCERTLIITEDQLISENLLTDNKILFSSNEIRDGIMDNSSYSIDEYKLLKDDPIRIFIRSDMLQGEITMNENSFFSVCQYYCGSTCHSFKRVY